MPLIVVAMSTVFMSGALLLPGFIHVRLEWDFPGRLPSELRVGVAALHLLAGILAALILGGLWSVHMRTHWRHHEHRQSGLATAILLLLLAASGAGIYYLSGEVSSLATSAAHVVVGVVFGVMFGWHALTGYRARRKRGAARR